MFAFAVSRRSREIGIRMALGARSQQVVWSVVRGVAGLTAVGIGVGMVLSLMVIMALRAFSNPAPGVSNIAVYRPSVDPIGLTAITLFIAIVGIVAAFIPARRPATMDPLIALRRS